MNVLDYDMCAFSTNGQYVAVALSNCLIIKKHPFSGLYIKTMADHTIDHLQWNNTSDSILCAELSKGIVQVYDVNTKKWIFTIVCGYFKFIAAEWICRTKILLTLEFHIALAVFDLLKKSIFYIEIPKPIWPCVVFDNNGTHMFVVSKNNGYEKLLMIHSQSLDRIIYIQDVLGSCDGINKSPDNRFICIFNKQKLAILNFNSGNVIVSIEYVLTTVSWSPNGEYLALGSSFGNIVVLSSANEFNTELKLSHLTVHEDYDFFMESNRVLIKTNSLTEYINYITKKIASIAWSFDCSYLSSFEVDSTFLYIWEKYKLICVVKFVKEIKKMQWCQSENKLSVVCGTDLIFIWTKEETPKLQESPKLINGTCLLASSISWSFNNKDLILSDGNKFLLFTI